MNANPSLGSAADVRSPPATRRVVDAPTRVFHWLFALSFLGAYLTAEGERLRLLHVTLGYTMAGLLVFRVLYGLLGPRQAALSVLWRKLAGLWPWAQSLQGAVRTQSPAAVNWRQGQNLFMALAIVALLVLVLPLTLSGYATYNEWGDVLGDWVGDVHAFFGDAILAVVLAHVAAIVGLSVLRRKNIAIQMVSGRVAGPGPDLAKRNYLAVGALLLCAVLAYWTWEWQQSPQGLFSVSSISAALRDQGGDDD
jgi:cytochrome b